MTRSYHAAQNGKYNKQNSAFINVNHNKFSEKIPRKYLGHRGRYDYRLPKMNVKNVDKIKSGCISQQTKKQKMKLFKYQKFISAYVDPRTPYSCLIWHSVGSGKTMTMWHIIEGYLRRWHCEASKKQIFLISNPKQLEGFENELKTFDKITGLKKHITKFSRSVKYGDSNRKARYGTTMHWKKTGQTVSIILMNFVEASAYAKKIGFQKSVVLLDEAHNVANPPPTYARYKKQFAFLAKHLSDVVSTKSVKVLPLTATPIKENVSEMSVLLNMVSKKLKFPTDPDIFIHKYGNNIQKLKKDTRGLISYFNREADLTVQPRKQLRDTTYGEMYIPLGEHQTNAMMKTIKKGNTPKQNINLLRVLSTFSGTGKQNVENNCPILESHLMKFGPKFLEVYNSIQKTTNEKHWVYCGLSRRAGVKPMAETLLCSKWTRVLTDKVKTDAALLKRVLTTLSHGNSVSQLPGKDYERFIVLESTTPKQLSSLALQIVNHHHNVSGKLIRVIIGDSSRKEGMDLYSIKHVHILSPEPKYSDWHQAVSRAIRYCSFKFVPLVKDWTVNVYTYVSNPHMMSTPNEKNKRGMKKYEKQAMLRIDEKMIHRATTNAQKLLPYLQAFKEAAVDCYLNKGMHAIENIDCHMRYPIVNKRKDKKVIKTPSAPKTKSPELSWIVYFSRVSKKTLDEWKAKCKSGKCTRVQKDALKVALIKRRNPFSGIGNNTSIHISEVTNVSKSRNGYRNGYYEYNYNTGYKKGSMLNASPKLENLSNRPPSGKSYLQNKYEGVQQARINAMRNGLHQL